jgi:hypothetical protein
MCVSCTAGFASNVDHVCGMISLERTHMVMHEPRQESSISRWASGVVGLFVDNQAVHGDCIKSACHVLVQEYTEMGRNVDRAAREWQMSVDGFNRSVTALSEYRQAFLQRSARSIPHAHGCTLDACVQPMQPPLRREASPRVPHLLTHVVYTI